MEPQHAVDERRRPTASSLSHYIQQARKCNRNLLKNSSGIYAPHWRHQRDLWMQAARQLKRSLEGH